MGVHRLRALVFFGSASAALLLACSSTPLTGCEAAVVALAHPCSLPISDDMRAALVDQAKTVCDSLRAAPGIVQLDTNAQACADAMTTMRDCSLPLQCVGVVGTLPVGAACAMGAQCASGNCSAEAGLLGLGWLPPSLPRTCGTCLDTFAGTPCTTTCSYGFACVGGTCVASAGNAGDPCNGSGTPDGCNAPFHCESQHCVAPSPAGAACTFTSDCEQGLACDLASATCVTTALEGASCIGVPCADGLAGCDGNTQTCVKPTFVDEGQPCGGATFMCKRGQCVPLPNGSGQCPKIVPVGRPCDVTDHTQACDEMVSCTNGTCELFDPRTCM